MASLEAAFDATVHDDKGLVNVAAKAVGQNGKVIFFKAAGRQRFASDEPANADTVHFIASCSKLIATIAAMQCVEQGLLGLDDDVTQWLPELKDGKRISLSEPFNHMDPAGQARLEKGDIPSVITEDRKGTITLRHFLTNTSGFAYDQFDPTSCVWRASRGQGPQTNLCKLSNLADQPVIFEPGQNWAYGLGFEWAGELVARLHKTTLDDYLRENVFKPLGRNSTTFRPWNHPDIMAREAELAVRTPDGGLAPGGHILPRPAPDDMGGIGLYSTVEDYVAVLADLVAPQPKLLKPETADEFFKPQLGVDSGAWQGLINSKHIWAPLTGFPPDVSEEVLRKVDFGLSGVYIVEDTPSLPAGTLSWWGMPNHTWFANRRLGVAGLFATQLLPPGDKVAIGLSAKFRDHVFAKDT